MVGLYGLKSVLVLTTFLALFYFFFAFEEEDLVQVGLDVVGLFGRSHCL